MDAKRVLYVMWRFMNTMRIKNASCVGRKKLRIKKVPMSQDQDPVDTYDNLILAVDPGSNGTGWAILNENDAHVIDFGTVHGHSTDWHTKSMEILKEMSKIYSRISIGRVYIESPVFMRGHGGYTTASTGSLVKLAALFGALYFTSAMHHITIPVEPSQWKGQLPKKTCNNRIKMILEQKRLYGNVGRVSTHALDAIGIGLWAVGEF